MAHVRTQIRNKVRDLLTDHVFTSGATFENFPWDGFPMEEDIPEDGLVIHHLPGETVLRDPPDVNRTQYRRAIRVVVTCVARINAGDMDRAVEDRLDEIAVDVEKALAGDLTFGAYAALSTLTGTNLEPLPDECGSLRLDMLYEVEAWTPANQPDIEVVP